MERRGVKVDRDDLARLSAEFTVQIAALEERIYEAAAGRSPSAAPQQLGEVLYEKIGLKGGRKGKCGPYSTDVTELERLAREGVDCATLVLDWRQLTKLKIDLYRRAAGADQPGDRPRPHQLLAVRRADRAALLDRPQSAEHPDPHRDRPPDPRRVRRRGRHMLLTADYSQIELRLAAHMADVPQLKEASRRRRHPQHDRGGIVRHGQPRHPRQAKTINFAILYGISRWGLAGRLGVPRKKAGDHRPLFRALPRHPRYIDETLAVRPRERLHPHPVRPEDAFPRSSSPNQPIRAGAERAAINAPIQGTSADLIKRAMARMDAALAAAGLRGRADAAPGP